MHYSINDNFNPNLTLTERIDAILEDTKAPVVERWIRIAGLAEHDERIAPLMRLHLHRELPNLTDREKVLRALVIAERRRAGPLATMMRNIAAYRAGESEHTAKPPEPEAISESTEFTAPSRQVRIDPEIGRLAIGLKLSAQHRIWATMRQHAGSRGHVTLDELQQILSTFGIHHGQRYLLRLLHKGSGIFWNLSRDNNRIYYRSSARTGLALIKRARAANLQDLYTTNLPGGRDVWVPIPQDLQSWKAYVYAAWFAWRESPQIARDTLCSLFGTTKQTLYNWEEALPAEVLNIRRNEAQSIMGNVDQVPAHATQYMTWDKQIRYHWQTSSTYTSTLVVHAHKGQARRVREMAGREAFGQPVNAPQAQPEQSGSHWFDRSHRTLRRYHNSLSKVQQLVRLEVWIEERSGIPKGFRKQEMYLWRGTNAQGRGIWEYIPREAPFQEIPEGWQPQTKADERVPLKVEYRRDWLGDFKRAEHDYLNFRRAQGELA